MYWRKRKFIHCNTVYTITLNNMWQSFESTVINTSLINNNFNITRLHTYYGHIIQECMNKLLLTINLVLPEILNHMQASP